MDSPDLSNMSYFLLLKKDSDSQSSVLNADLVLKAMRCTPH